jgi:altronate dehydratase small subunit
MPELKQQAVVLNPKDNVATALSQLEAGSILLLKVGEQRLKIKLKAPVPFGHKFSISQITPGSPVIKYGEVIGTSTRAIQPGDYVHVHNVASARGRGDLAKGVK